MELNRNIEKYAEDYVSHDFEDVMIKFRIKKILEVLNVCKPDKILEIGCGPDSIFNYYKSFVSATIVEPSGIFCQKAKKDFENNGKVNIFQNFFEERIDDFVKEKYDFILLSSLLHEVNDPIDLLKKIRLISGTDTIIHINVPNALSFHLLWAYESGLLKEIGALTPTAKHLQQNCTFTLDSLSKFVSENGFAVLEKGSYFIKPFNHKKMFQLARDGFLDENLLNGLEKIIKYFPESGSEIFLNCKRYG